MAERSYREMDMESLESSKLFQLITEEETQRILKCSKARMRQHPAGTYIFEQGGVPTRLFLLLGGQVQICKDFTSGKRDVLFRAVLFSGNLCGKRQKSTGAAHYQKKLYHRGADGH